MHTFTRLGGAWALVLALVALPSPAQSQLSVEVRGGLQAPVGDFGDVAGSDAGFGGDLFFSVSPRLSVYGGWGIENFDDDIESKGFEAGGKFVLASVPGGVIPWLRAGAILHELEVEGIGTTDHELGFQSSIGVDLPLGEVLSFSPAVRFQTYSPEFEGILGAFEESVNFFSFDFGLHFHPGV